MILITAQFALLLFLVQRLKLESDAFLTVLVLSFGAFLFQHLLPERRRVPFIVAFSLAGFALVLGEEAAGFSLATGIARTGTLLGVGLSLIGICHLPIAWPARIALLLAAGAGLAALRAGAHQSVALDPIWPVLGSIFMFRLLVYVYDLRHETARQPFSNTLAYFFLLPNVCFPLFPVIDFKTFGQSRDRGELLATYQEGVEWMARGALQLVLWRVVYYHVYLDPSRIGSGEDLALYLLGNVALYLRVSGQFHLVIGLLHLFGWRLPETNRRYFLAASVSDYWRRVNIYWKDFIVKLFYFPVLFRMKRHGEVQSLVAATLLAFGMTWLLHSYQSFWLRGSFSLRIQDALFWGALALLVTANSIFELRRGRPRRLRPRPRSLRESIGVGLRTAATFCAITLLWSLWTADSVRQWLEIWRYADATTLGYAGAAALGVGLCAIVLEAPPRLGAVPRTPAAPRPYIPRLAAPASLALLLLAFGISSPRMQDRLPLAGAEVAKSLRDTRPNKSDEEYLVRGYYENLMDTGRFDSLGRGDPTAPPAGWGGLAQVNASDLRNRVLVPGVETQVNGKTVRTNSQGMRDREYPLERSPDTLRIAMLGSSVVMGWGVSDDEMFESRLEERLNRELSPATGQRYELLNFAVNGYSPLAQLEVMRQQVLRFRPDRVVLFGHTQDPFFTVHELAVSLRARVQLPEPVRAIAARAEVDAQTPERWAERRLADHWQELLRFAFEEIYALSRGAGVVPVFVYLPDPVQRNSRQRDLELFELARTAGFVAISLRDAYRDVEWSQLTLAAWDHHPNSAAQAMLADALYEALQHDDPLGLRGSGGGSRLRRGERGLSMGDRAEIESAVKLFILDAFLPGEDPAELTAETELVSSGILDSVATLRLVNYLEDQFGIQIDAHEADAEHLNTVARIAALVASKQR